MWKENRALLNETDAEVANRQTASLAGLAITLLLAVLGLFLVRGLQANDTIGYFANHGEVNCDLVFHDTTMHHSAPV